MKALATADWHLNNLARDLYRHDWQARLRKLREAWKTHKKNASKRRPPVPFLLTFDEWLAIWIGSGHLAERGPKIDQYVMARFEDKGPYAVGNVKIITGRQNRLEVSEETECLRRRKIAKFQTGQKRSAATRQRITEAANRRGPISDETRRRQSESHTGKPLSKAQREGLRSHWEAQRGKKRPPEVCAKISATKKLRKNARGLS